MLQDGITCLHDIVINWTFGNTHHVSNLLHCRCIPIASKNFNNTMTWSIDARLPTFPKTFRKTPSSSTRLFNCMTDDQSMWKLDRNSSSDMYVPSSNILSQLLSHCLYGPRKQYLNAFNTANSAKMQLSMSSSELSSSMKHRRMKAFLTRCSASASHSLIEIALLVCLGILEGFFHMRRVHLTTKKKNLFVIFSVLGCSKLLSLHWLSQKFPRLNIFARKKLSMLHRTLTTPST